MTPSFPTRRSSDLHEGAAALLDAQQALLLERGHAAAQGVAVDGEARGELGLGRQSLPRREDPFADVLLQGFGNLAPQRHPRPPRSEEHTSELQSLMRISYAVFCLKKKQHSP